MNSIPHNYPGAHTALVVEDDYGARLLLIQMLETLEINCVVAETGEQAQELMKDRNVDIMLLDIALGPGMSGLQLGYNLTRQEQHRGTPVVAVTAYTLEKLENLHQMGFKDYLPKPYTIYQLKLLLDKYLPDRD